MKRILRGVRHGEKGFTMIELLIVIAILGILAAVVVPNLAGFIGAGNRAAANQEVATVETAAMAYYADHNPPVWPTPSSVVLFQAPPGTSYLSAETVYADYTFDTYGRVLAATNKPAADSAGIVWVTLSHTWEKAP